jgi:hypothetical protein
LFLDAFPASGRLFIVVLELLGLPQSSWLERDMKYTHSKALFFTSLHFTSSRRFVSSDVVFDEMPRDICCDHPSMSH